MPYDASGTRRGLAVAFDTRRLRNGSHRLRRDRAAGRRRSGRLHRRLHSRQLIRHEPGGAPTTPSSASWARADADRAPSSPSIRPTPSSASAISYVNSSADASFQRPFERLTGLAGAARQEQRSCGESSKRRRRAGDGSETSEGSITASLALASAASDITGQHVDLDQTHQRIDDEIVGSKLPETTERLLLQRDGPGGVTPPSSDPRESADGRHDAVRVVCRLRHAAGPHEQLLGGIRDSVAG